MCRPGPRWPARSGSRTPLITQPAGCIGAGDAGFFCKYAQSYLLDHGFTVEQLNRGGYTIKTTLDANVLAKVKASVNQQVPPGQPNVADVMSVVAPGADQHRVLAMASNRTFGLDAGRRETSYGLPYEPVNLGAGSTYKIFTSAVALEKGRGIDYVLRGAAVRVRVPDLRRRGRAADPGRRTRATTPTA